jgi:hypothetical protein
LFWGKKNHHHYLLQQQQRRFFNYFFHITACCAYSRLCLCFCFFKSSPPTVKINIKKNSLYGTIKKKLIILITEYRKVCYCSEVSKYWLTFCKWLTTSEVCCVFFELIIGLKSLSIFRSPFKKSCRTPLRPYLSHTHMQNR